MKTADVVVIGGGCMGASVAYHLTRRGITNVLLLEREPMLATGSTGRNAGGVSRSRLRGSAKKAKTSGRGRASHTRDSST